LHWYPCNVIMHISISFTITNWPDNCLIIFWYIFSNFVSLSILVVWQLSNKRILIDNNKQSNNIDANFKMQKCEHNYMANLCTVFSGCLASCSLKDFTLCVCMGLTENAGHENAGHITKFTVYKIVWIWYKQYILVTCGLSEKQLYQVMLAELKQNCRNGIQHSAVAHLT